MVQNNTANSLIFTVGSGTTFTVPAARDAFITCDGSGVFNALADLQVTTVNGVDVGNAATKGFAIALAVAL